MSTLSTQRPSHYARMICDHMKTQPNFYAPNLDAVKAELGLSDETFKMGLDWCIARKIITLDSAKPRVRQAIDGSVEEEAMKGESSRLSSLLRAPSFAEAS